MNDLFTELNLVVALFVVTYILIVLYYDKKTYIIWTSIIVLMLFKVLGPLEAFKAVNWNVIGIYVGMLFVSEMFIYSRAPDEIAGKIVNKSKKVWIALLGICFFSGFLSVVVENVAVVLIVAPIALTIAKKLNVHPGPMMVGIAVSSNLQGVATMIGDPPSLLLASYAELKFIDFFFFHGKLSLFFAVQIAAIISLIVLYFCFRKFQNNIKRVEVNKVLSYVPSLTMITLIVLLIITSLITYAGKWRLIGFLLENNVGIICMAAGIFIAAWYYALHCKKLGVQASNHKFINMTKRLDWDTGLFLVGVFILVASVIKVGFIHIFASWIASFTGSNAFLAFNLIVWSSVLISAFVDNVPFMATMLPVVGKVAEFIGVSPYLLYFGLVIGASVGGNITPVGASANIVAMGMLKKKGYQFSFMDFVKIGLPFTIVSVIASTTFIWLMFS